MDWIKYILVVVSCGYATASSASSEAGGSRPNVIIILTDDQGYADLGCYGSKQIKSPNLNQMAAEGLRLTNFYSVSSVCSPSRAGLLTGRMPKRAGVPGVLFPDSQTGLSPDEITLAELLKQQGYRTGIVGKWHLGHLKQYLPLNQGFDSYLGIPYSNDMSIAPELEIAANVTLNQGYTLAKLKRDVAISETNFKSLKGKVPLLRGNAVIDYPTDQKLLTRRYTEEAVTFIEAKSGQPFFLYLAHTMPHKPFHIEKALAGQSEGGLYGDIIEQIDWSVGEVMQALKDNGLDRNTLVFFTSDNGPIPKNGGSTGPFKGSKATTYEGGHRVPAIFWAPGMVKGGQVSDAMACSVDLFPTIAHYTGTALPEGRIYDGISLAGLLEGSASEPPRTEFVYYVANTEVVDGVRVGDWKYLLRGQRRPKVGQRHPQLYNVREDPAESQNLIEQYPEKASALEKRIQELDTSMVW